MRSRRAPTARRRATSRSPKSIPRRRRSSNGCSRSRALMKLPVLALAVLVAAPVAAQEPVVPVADPEALFVDDDPKLHANKQLALHFMRELLQCNHWERAPEWLNERYLQHNPNGRSGRD